MRRMSVMFFTSGMLIVSCASAIFTEEGEEPEAEHVERGQKRRDQADQPEDQPLGPCTYER